MSKIGNRYRVAGYSDGYWCIVDSMQFLSERERTANWPMQVHWHPLVGNVGVFIDKGYAERLAGMLNEHEGERVPK